MTAPDQGCPTFPTGWATQLSAVAAKGQYAVEYPLGRTRCPAHAEHIWPFAFIFCFPRGSSAPQQKVDCWLEGLLQQWWPVPSHSVSHGAPWPLPHDIRTDVHFPCNRKLDSRQIWSHGLTHLHLCLPEMRRCVRSIYLLTDWSFKMWPKESGAHMFKASKVISSQEDCGAVLVAQWCYLCQV